MEPTQDLIGSIDRDRIARARRESIEQKMWEGPKLFEGVVERMKMGIRLQFPDASDSEVLDILWQRLRRLRQVQDHGIFVPVELSDDE